MQPRSEEGITGHLDVGLAKTPVCVEVVEQLLGLVQGKGKAAHATDLEWAEDLGVHADEGRPALGLDVLDVSVAALARTNNVGADGDSHGGLVGAEEDDDAVLVGDVEEERLFAGGEEEDGFCAGVAHCGGGAEGDVAVAGDGEAFEEGGSEGELCVFDEVVFEDGGLFLWGEQGEGALGLDFGYVSMSWCL